MNSVVLNLMNHFKFHHLTSSKNIIVDKFVDCRKTTFEGFNRIGRGSLVKNCELGKYSYIGKRCNLSNTQIGRYCSIGPECVLIVGTHPKNYVSTHPIFYSTRKQCGVSFTNTQHFEEQLPSGPEQSRLTIGHDVWIGYGVKILEGVKIGNGAIVMAGAVVTSDIEPYSIVGGLPAKLVNYRFEADIRKKLNDSNWWFFDDDWVKNNASAFLNSEIFLKIIEQ